MIFWAAAIPSRDRFEKDEPVRAYLLTADSGLREVFMHRRVALLSAAALALAGTLVPAQAQAADHRPGPWAGAGSSSERRNVLQCWTPQRMLAAQPVAPIHAPRRARASRA